MQLDQRGLKGTLGQVAKRETQASRAKLGKRAPWANPERLANLERQDPTARQGLQASKEMKGRLENQESKGQLAKSGSLDLSVQLDLKVLQALAARLGQKEARGRQGHLETKAALETEVSKAWQGQLALEARLERLVLQVQKETRAMWVQKVMLEALARKVILEPTVMLAKLVKQVHQVLLLQQLLLQRPLALMQKPLTQKPLTPKPLAQKPLMQKPLMQKPLAQKQMQQQVHWNRPAQCQFSHMMSMAWPMLTVTEKPILTTRMLLQQRCKKIRVRWARFRLRSFDAFMS